MYVEGKFICSEYVPKHNRLTHSTTQKFRSSLFKGLQVPRVAPLAGFGAAPQLLGKEVDEDMKEIVERLCVAQGVSGSETELYALLHQMMDGIADVSVDRFGNIVAAMGDPNAAKHILLDAHIDRIGLIVTYINEKGFLKAEPVGGIDLRTLPGSAVTILGQEAVTGVICTMPPHLAEDEELSRDKIWIDTGLPAEKVQELVSLGDKAVLCSRFTELLNGRVAVSALDNRSGCAVLVRCAQLLKGQTLPCRVSMVFSALEEVNEAGAAAAAYLLAPDEAVVVDVGFAKQKGVPPEKSGPLGCGTIITLSPVLSRSVTQKIQALAKRLDMACDYEVCGGSTGTNADKITISKGGVPTGLVSIPSKNMHTPTEMVLLDDMEKLAQLLTLYIMEGGASHA